MRGKDLHDAAIIHHQSRAARAVAAYWHALTCNGSVPKRAEIDPRAIQDALEYTFMAERISGGHARFRLAGGAVKALMGMELAGMPLLSVFNPAHRQDTARNIADAFDRPATLTISLLAPGTYAQPQLDGTLQAFPLRDDTEHMTHLIGTLVTTGQIGRVPRRFDVTSTQMAPVPSFASPRAGGRSARGHLRLVVSNT